MSSGYNIYVLYYAIKMTFILLTSEQILQLSENDLHTYLQQVKAYVISLKKEITQKREILTAMFREEISVDKTALSERNKDIIEELKNRL